MVHISVMIYCLTNNYETLSLSYKTALLFLAFYKVRENMHFNKINFLYWG